jgi:hypothetical protein
VRHDIDLVGILGTVVDLLDLDPQPRRVRAAVTETNPLHTSGKVSLTVSRDA